MHMCSPAEGCAVFVFFSVTQYEQKAMNKAGRSAFPEGALTAGTGVQ